MDSLEVVEVEYETIVLELEHCVFFRIDGKEVEISRGVLVDYDLKGRLYLGRDDLEKFGLKASS